MKASDFAAGQYVMLKPAEPPVGTYVVRGLRHNRAYKIISGITPQNPNTIVIEVNGKGIGYSLFMFNALTPEESKLANLLGDI